MGVDTEDFKKSKVKKKGIPSPDRSGNPFMSRPFDGHKRLKRIAGLSSK